MSISRVCALCLCILDDLPLKSVFCIHFFSLLLQEKDSEMSFGNFFKPISLSVFFTQDTNENDVSVQTCTVCEIPYLSQVCVSNDNLITGNDDTISVKYDPPTHVDSSCRFM